MRGFALIAICTTACRFTPGELTGDARPADAAIDMMPDASLCLAVSTECIGDTLRSCSAVGAVAVDTPCGWGCTPGRCKTLTPSSESATLADTLPDPMLLPITLGGGITIDTHFGNIGTLGNSESIRGMGQNVINGISFEQRGETGVFRMKSLHLVQGGGAPLRFVGPEAPVIIVDGEILIDGIVDLRGGICASEVAGPRGWDGGLKNVPGEDYPNHGAGNASSMNKFGGGGGGYGTAGGKGGNGPTPADLEPAGGTTFGDAVMTELSGGGGGGGGGGGAGGAGGGGGGAIQLISNTRIRIVSGGVNAGGCGGQSGNGGNDAGGGGGAGGTILLETPILEITSGALAVNGGAGGAGTAGNANRAPAGVLSRSPALGAAGTGTGGNGAAGATAATAGGTTGGKGGGGGGGIGRIRILTRDDMGVILGTASVLSPHYNDPSSTCTRAAAMVQ